MFYFISKRGNYSESVEVCRNKNGVLADVTSEYRTNALAKLLADLGAEEAYISLKRDISSDFITTNGKQIKSRCFIYVFEYFLIIKCRVLLQNYFLFIGDLLDCTSYRAWAPGHPKKWGKTDCVTITRHQTWRSVSCEVRLAAICEIIPGKNTGKPSLNIM